MVEAFPYAPPPPDLTSKTRFHVSPLAYGVLGVFVAIVVAAYFLLQLLATPHAQRLSTIQAMPEASLLAPGSHVLYQHGSVPSNLFGLGTISDAFTDKVAGTDESPAEVLAFYASNLARLGWQGPQPDSTAFGATVARRWQRQHYVIDVDILGPQSGSYPGQDQYATAYVIELQYTSVVPPTQTPTG
jgi:hypothetical protein